MPGGLHPPLEVIISWPTPNYDNPVIRPKVATVLACIFGSLSLALLLARLWVRLYIQRNTGLDDWLMMIAIIPIVILTVIIPLAADYNDFNKHVWDVPPTSYVTQRKYILAIETTFVVGSGLIKISILLFYTRLGSRAVSNTFRWVTRITIALVVAYSIAFTLIPIFGCRPISAFWDQLNFIKLANGYTYKCFNEGADIFAAAVISAVQDLLTAILPTFLYLHLQIPLRQKVALFFIFAIGYGVVAIGAYRAYLSWQIFFGTYDVTWVAGLSIIWTLLELYIGAICANAPAMKVFFRQILNLNTSASGSKSHSKGSGTRSFTNKISRSSWSGWTVTRMQMSGPGSQDSEIARLPDPLAELEGDNHGISQKQHGHQPTDTPISGRTSVDTISGRYKDIEMGAVRMQSDENLHNPTQLIAPSLYDIQNSVRISGPYPAFHLPGAYDGTQKPSWQAWT